MTGSQIAVLIFIMIPCLLFAIRAGIMGILLISSGAKGGIISLILSMLAVFVSMFIFWQAYAYVFT